jgi:alpha-L-arabinofuranosidase
LFAVDRDLAQETRLDVKIGGISHVANGQALSLRHGDPKAVNDSGAQGRVKPAKLDDVTVEDVGIGVLPAAPWSMMRLNVADAP